METQTNLQSQIAFLKRKIAFQEKQIAGSEKLSKEQPDRAAFWTNTITAEKKSLQVYEERLAALLATNDADYDSQQAQIELEIKEGLRYDSSELNYELGRSGMLVSEWNKRNEKSTEVLVASEFVEKVKIIAEKVKNANTFIEFVEKLNAKLHDKQQFAKELDNMYVYRHKTGEVFILSYLSNFVFEIQFLRGMKKGTHSVIELVLKFQETQKVSNNIDIEGLAFHESLYEKDGRS